MPPPQEPFVPNRDLPGPRLEKGSSLLEATTSLAEGRRSVWLLAESPCPLELPHGAKLCRQGSVPPPSAPRHTGWLVDLVVASDSFCATELQSDLRQVTRPPRVQHSDRHPQDAGAISRVTWLGPVQTSSPRISSRHILPWAHHSPRLQREHAGLERPVGQTHPHKAHEERSRNSDCADVRLNVGHLRFRSTSSRL